MVKFQSIELNRLVSMKSGETITAQHIDDYGEYPCFGGNGLRGYTKKYTHHGAFALIGRQGALCGNVTYVNGYFFASEHAIVVTPKEENIIKYIYYVLDAMHLNQYVESSAQPGLSVNKLLNLSAYVSTDSNEQQRIATVLADIDTLISSLKTLIAKKKAIKQGAMQELLTGKKRLPGFSGEWKSDMLPDILQKDMGIKIGPFGSQLRKEYLLEDGPYRVYGQENVYGHDFTIGTRYLSKERFQQLQSCEICPGDFLISTMGTIGKCAIVPEGLHKGIMDSHLIRLRINKQKILPEYLLHLFSEELGYLKNQTSKLSVGGIMDGLSTKIVNSLTVYFPVNLVEQQAIAKVLTDLDTEVKALEQKLEKYRQVKQGMMQQLLTGKIRLV